MTPTVVCACSSASSGGSRWSTCFPTSSMPGPRLPVRAWRRTAGAARRRRSITTPAASFAAASCSAASSETAMPSCASVRLPRSRCAAIPKASTSPWTSSAPGRGKNAAKARASSCRRSPSGASAGAIRPRHGYGGSPSTRATCTRSTRSSAGRRRSACWGCSSTRPAPPTAQRPPPRARGPQARPPPRGRAACVRGGTHARGGRGAARRPQQDGSQALRAGARAGAQLPQGQAPRQQEATRRPRRGLSPRYCEAGQGQAEELPPDELAELEDSEAT